MSSIGLKSKQQILLETVMESLTRAKPDEVIHSNWKTIYMFTYIIFPDLITNWKQYFLHIKCG